MKKRRILLLIILVAAAGFLMAVGHQLLDVPQAGQRMIASFERLLGRPVQVGTVTFFPLGGLAIKLHQLVVPAADGRPLLQIDEVIVGLSPEFLLQGTLRFSSVTLVDPQIRLYQQPDQSWGEQLFVLLEEMRQHGERQQERLAVSSTIGRLTVRNGRVLTEPAGHSGPADVWMDGVHANLLDFSPTRPTPIRLSGRLKRVPFTLDGQLGPLPASGEWLSLPVMINVDMKAFGAATLAPLLTALHLGEIWPGLRAARGQLVLTLRGNIQHGLQSRAELRLAQLSRPTPWPVQQLTLQQKSLLRLDLDHNRRFVPLLLLQEGRIHLNNLPWLDVKGTVQWLQSQPHFSLELAALQAVDMAVVASLMREQRYLAMPIEWPLPAGRIKGQWLLLGSWAGAVNFFGQLDLSRATLAWPPFHKEAGVPLMLELRGSYADQELHLQQAVMTATDRTRLEWFGRLAPTQSLTMVGQVEGTLLKDYLPALRHWSLRGDSRVQMTWSRHPDQTVAEMWFNTGPFHLGGFDISDGTAHVRWSGSRFFIPTARFRLAQGWVNLSGMVYGQAPTWGYDVTTSFQDVVAEALGETPLQPILLDRMLAPLLVGHDSMPLSIESARCSGYSTFRGWLTADGVERPVAGRLHLELAPGRLSGSTRPQWPERPMVEQDEKMAGVAPERLEGVEIAWDHATVDVVLDQERVLFRNLLLQSDDLEIQGSGRHDDSGTVDDQLQFWSPWWRDPRPVQLHLSGDRDRPTLSWQTPAHSCRP
ncbi:MAG: hypothetical protein HQL58_03565 [Magnetococcales bacterium]|nr:hypothetical protein [Magnetococcales bacterium]